MIVDITTFRLAPGVDDAKFLDADAEVQAELMRSSEAFVRRTTARGTGGEWLELSFWWREPDAADGPASRAFAELIDPASRRTTRYETIA